MERRTKRLGLWVACACLSLSGCEGLRSQGLRGNSRGDSVRPSVYDDYLGQADDEPRSPEDPRGFFQRTRRPGGLSDEARSIERDIFNIY
ncbi:hypothetical protein BH23PLA1_BH23PLA1_26830 [soil metagenome]